jgi:recombination protein RecR
MDPIHTLAKLFKEFPGIGERQAYRIVYDILSREKSFTDNLIESLKKVREKTALCPQCFRRYPYDNVELCDICGNSQTDTTSLLVVERDTDLTAIHRTGLYKGLYFVLGGSLPLLEKEPQKKIKLSQLLKRTEELSKKGLSEIIIATSATPSGEHTDEVIKKHLEQFKNVRVQSLGRGISTGTEIEYIDAETLRGALQNRH